jgi:LacI family transcriptional regulator
MKDIARATGLSLSTVDRVLNNRGSARSATAERVLEAARQLGYLPAPAPLTQSELRRFDVIIQDGGNTFLQRLSESVEAAARRRSGRIEVRLHRIPGFSAPELCGALDAIETSDGVAAIALDHPLVRDSLRRLRDRGIPLATLVSDVAGIDRFCYVGIDNRAAGRLAGHVINRLVRTPGTVAIFRGSPSYRGHEERENGCRAYLAESAPHLALALAAETSDQIEASRQATLDLLRAYRDLVAIYNVAGGNRGIAAALKETGRAAEVVYIAHELSAHAREYLVSGVMDLIIDQNAEMEGEVLVAALEAQAAGMLAAPPPISMQLYLPENLP